MRWKWQSFGDFTHNVRIGAEQLHGHRAFLWMGLKQHLRIFVMIQNRFGALMIREIRRNRQEMFESLSLYYRVFILKENYEEMF